MNWLSWRYGQLSCSSSPFASSPCWHQLFESDILNVEICWLSSLLFHLMHKPWKVPDHKNLWKHPRDKAEWPPSQWFHISEIPYSGVRIALLWTSGFSCSDISSWLQCWNLFCIPWPQDWLSCARPKRHILLKASQIWSNCILSASFIYIQSEYLHWSRSAWFCLSHVDGSNPCESGLTTSWCSAQHLLNQWSLQAELSMLKPFVEVDF